MAIHFKNLDKIINKIYIDKLFKNENRTQILFGGAGSGKSFSIAQKIVLDSMIGKNTLIVRKTASSIKKSTLNEVVSKISDFKLMDYFNVNGTEKVITNIKNNSQIIFCGVDDPEKLKSIVPKKGVIHNAWIEECTEIEKNTYKQITKRLRGITKYKKHIYLSFNPILKTHWIYKEFFEGFWEDDKQYIEKNDLSILKTTYKDNRFLAEDDIYAFENEDDKYYYDVYTLGNWGVLGAIIFKDYLVQDFNTECFDVYRNGVDWGFSQDPYAFIRIAVDNKRKILYICKEFYKTGLLNENSANLIKPIVKKEPVYCDSAEPKSIEEYNRLGIKAYSAKKGAGSIAEGIKFIQKYKIIIHPSCVNFQNEMMMYKYKEDKAGNALPQPVDKNNHLIDALRYALSTEITPKANKYAKQIQAKKNQLKKLLY